jgi:Leucine-rich repeat (LRR) protein
MSYSRPIGTPYTQYDPNAFLPTEEKTIAVASKEIQRTDESKMAPAPDSLDVDKITLSANRQVSDEEDRALMQLWVNFSGQGIKTALKECMLVKKWELEKNPSLIDGLNATKHAIELIDQFEPSSANDIREFLRKPEIAPWLLEPKLLSAKELNLQVFPKELATLFPNLIYLDLSFNEIRALDPDTLKGFTRLTALNLSYNKIDNVPPNLLEHVPHLKSLDLRRNKLIELPANFLSPIRETLAYLDLSENPFQELPTVLRTYLEGAAEFEQFIYQNSLLSDLKTALDEYEAEYERGGLIFIDREKVSPQFPPNVARLYGHSIKKQNLKPCHLVVRKNSSETYKKLQLFPKMDRINLNQIGPAESQLIKHVRSDRSLISHRSNEDVLASTHLPYFFGFERMMYIPKKV